MNLQSILYAVEEGRFSPSRKSNPIEIMERPVSILYNTGYNCRGEMVCLIFCLKYAPHPTPLPCRRRCLA